MKNILFVLLLLITGYNSNGQTTPPTLPALYIDFQKNHYGLEPMSKAVPNNGEAIFLFYSLLLGSYTLTPSPEGIALEMTQIEGTTPVTIPLANLATYMAGRPLLNTVQIRQEYTALTNDTQRTAYFNEENRDVFIVERNTTNQTARITQVYWSNVSL
jgi:hypothetical protein